MPDKSPKKRREPPKALTPLERFMAKVEVNKETGCWDWQAHKNAAGYGGFIPRKRGKSYKAHRWAYEFIAGKTIPDGYVLDHVTCSRPCCCNPDHLEPVTERENAMRGRSVAAANSKKTHCNFGHPLSGDNLYLYEGKKTARQCKACRTRRAEEHRLAGDRVQVAGSARRGPKAGGGTVEPNLNARALDFLVGHPRSSTAEIAFGLFGECDDQLEKRVRAAAGRLVWMGTVERDSHKRYSVVGQPGLPVTVDDPVASSPTPAQPLFCLRCRIAPRHSARLVCDPCRQAPPPSP